MNIRIDSYWINDFIHNHLSDISGDCLIIGSDWHKKIYIDRIKNCHVSDRFPIKKISKFDCIFVFQFLNGIEDYESVMIKLLKKLKPDGSLFMSICSIAPGLYKDKSIWGISEMAVRFICNKCFPSHDYEIKTNGNVLTGRLAIEGKKASDLSHKELNQTDPYFPVLTCIHVKNVSKE